MPRADKIKYVIYYFEYCVAFSFFKCLIVYTAILKCWKESKNPISANIYKKGQKYPIYMFQSDNSLIPVKTHRFVCCIDILLTEHLLLKNVKKLLLNKNTKPVILTLSLFIFFSKWTKLFFRELSVTETYMKYQPFKFIVRKNITFLKHGGFPQKNTINEISSIVNYVFKIYIR